MSEGFDDPIDVYEKKKKKLKTEGKTKSNQTKTKTDKQPTKDKKKKRGKRREGNRIKQLIKRERENGHFKYWRFLYIYFFLLQQGERRK